MTSTREACENSPPATADNWRVVSEPAEAEPRRFDGAERRRISTNFRQFFRQPRQCFRCIDPPRWACRGI